MSGGLPAQLLFERGVVPGFNHMFHDRSTADIVLGSREQIGPLTYEIHRLPAFALAEISGQRVDNVTHVILSRLGRWAV
jgi:hypothetical protein